MIGSGHGALATLALANRPKLLEGRGPLDRGRVIAGSRVDVVVGTVTVYGAQVLTAY